MLLFWFVVSIYQTYCLDVIRHRQLEMFQNVEQSKIKNIIIIIKIRAEKCWVHKVRKNFLQHLPYAQNSLIKSLKEVVLDILNHLQTGFKWIDCNYAPSSSCACKHKHTYKYSLKVQKHKNQTEKKNTQPTLTGLTELLNKSTIFFSSGWSLSRSRLEFKRFYPYSKHRFIISTGWLAQLDMDLTIQGWIKRWWFESLSLNIVSIRSWYQNCELNMAYIISDQSTHIRLDTVMSWTRWVI